MSFKARKRQVRQTNSLFDGTRSMRTKARSDPAIDVGALSAVATRIEVVIVCYHSAPLVQALLTSWGPAFRACVADNGDGADELPEIVAGFPSARYLKLDGLGFARAANQAISSSTAEIVVIANPDCRCAVDDILRLAAGLAHDPDALCHGAVEEIGPSRYYCGGWEPTFFRCLVHSFGLHRLLRNGGILAIVDGSHKTPEVDWLSGTVAAFWRHHLLTAGGFDERFYVYTEDMALGNVALKLGLKQVVRDDIVVHPEPSGSGAPSLTMGGLQGASLAHYFAHYRGPIDGTACRAILAAGFMARSLAALFRGDRGMARRQWCFVRGIATGRAYVDGREVSESRARELRRRTARHRPV